MHICVQAQRDYFGAHTYELLSAPGTYVHTNWTGTGGNAEKIHVLKCRLYIFLQLLLDFLIFRKKILMNKNGIKTFL